MSDSEQPSKETSVDVLFKNEYESSEEPPMEEWTSLDDTNVQEETNPKRLLYAQGDYHPGSGDICTKYIALSTSSVMRHPYYKYPALLDPGIMIALQSPEDPVIYPDDGQKLYMAECQDMNLCPVRIFHKGLLTNEINLKYYGVNPKGVRAMANALKYNDYVKKFNLTDNFLSVDASYHLGDMLRSNSTLVELNLSGCRIGPDGAKALFTGMVANKTLRALNLSKNKLGDAGAQILADAIFNGLNIKMINLSYNDISGTGINTLSEAFEAYNNITHWDLSWNGLFSPETYNFLASMAETSKNLKKMDLSWNNLFGGRIGQGIKQFMGVKNLKHLNLSYNRLDGEAIKHIGLGLKKAKTLVSLNLSYNTMTPADAVLIAKKLLLKTVKVQRVYMDNVKVDVQFIKLLQEAKTSRPQLLVTHGYVTGTFKPIGVNLKEILLDRANYLCAKTKKKTDIGLIILQLHKDENVFMSGAEFVRYVRANGGSLDDDLVASLVDEFSGPRDDKGGKRISILKLVEYMKMKWPERKLPPTPPPEPEPEAPPPPPPKGKGGKGKEKGKGKK